MPVRSVDVSGGATEVPTGGVNREEPINLSIRSVEVSGVETVTLAQDLETKKKVETDSPAGADLAATLETGVPAGEDLEATLEEVETDSIESVVASDEEIVVPCALVFTWESFQDRVTAPVTPQIVEINQSVDLSTTVVPRVSDQAEEVLEIDVVKVDEDSGTDEPESPVEGCEAPQTALTK